MPHKNIEKRREYQRKYNIKWDAENKEKRNGYSRKWNAENKEKKRETNKRWNAENKERMDLLKKRWVLENPEKNRKHVANWRAAKLNATPAWLTDKQKEKTAKIYEKAAAMEKRTGTPYHVDHIVPLQGKNVCGLHVPWNLQILTATENITKGNRLYGQ